MGITDVAKAGAPEEVGEGMGMGAAERAVQTRIQIAKTTPKLTLTLR